MKPADYINMIRIQKACSLIKKEDISMEDVGFRVGYQTPSTFNRNFKKITGMSPYQWKSKSSKWENLQTQFNISARKGWEAYRVEFAIFMIELAEESVITMVTGSFD